nr:aminoacyl-tRNA synthetase, class 1a, anticodon-binding [Tanacetum cinerariifolium]
MVLSDSEGEEAATKEHEINLDALHELASASLGGDTTVEAAYTISKASPDAHASYDVGHDEDETIPAGSTPIPTTGGVSTGSSIEPASQAAAAAPSSSAIPAANKGKDPMVDDFIPADLLTEQEQVLKNLHDYQLKEDLAKKLQAKQEAKFARQQEELAQKAQAKSVASPAAQGTWLSAQRRCELDLLGDDVNEDNMNERLGMLLMRKRMELAEQSRVKPMNKTQQRDFIRDFVKNQSALVYNQGWTMKQVPASVLAALSIAGDVSFSAISTTTADVSVSELPIPTSVSVGVSTGVTEATTTFIPDPPPPTTSTEIPHTPISIPDQTASEQGFAEHTVNESTTVAFTSRESWRIRSCRLYPCAHVHVLETVDGRVIYMFVDVSYPLSEATMKHILKHGLEVPKLLVGGDLTMAEQLMLLVHDLAVFGVSAGCSCWFPHSCWFLVVDVWLFAAVLFRSCCWNNDAILELTSEDLSRILKLTLSNSRLGEDC